MRPTDENQQSTRPNLMSSGKRGGNEESILAMLERDSGRGGGVRASRLALYGVAGVLTAVLVGMLVWLARDQGATEVIMAQAPVPLPAPGTAPDAASAPQLVQSEAPAQASQAAVIVDEPQPPAVAERPPLVLLDPEKAEQHDPAAVQAKAAGKESMADSRSPATKADDTGATAGAQAASAPAAAARAEPRHAAKALARQESARPKTTAKSAAASPRPATRHAHRQEAKPKKPAAPPKPAEAVDSDVALISAVIQHASNRANAEAGDCGPDAKCAGKTTLQE